MRFPRNKDLVLAALLGGIALVVLLVWIPLDVDSGLLKTARRRVSVGDAAAPTLAALFVLLGAILLALEARGRAAQTVLNRQNLVFLAGILGIIGLGLIVMRWLGPGVAAVLTETGYRPLRDTTPWRQIGFFAGGTVLVTGLIWRVDRRVTLRAVVIAAVTALALIALYDLPFDDLLLPPNGDV